MFSTAGYSVHIYDNDEAKLKTGLESILSKMKSLEEKDCLRGTKKADEAFALIHPMTTIETCVKGVSYVQVSQSALPFPTSQIMNSCLSSLKH